MLHFQFGQLSAFGQALRAFHVVRQHKGEAFSVGPAGPTGRWFAGGSVNRPNLTIEAALASGKNAADSHAESPRQEWFERVIEPVAKHGRMRQDGRGRRSAKRRQQQTTLRTFASREGANTTPVGQGVHDGLTDSLPGRPSARRERRHGRSEIAASEARQPVWLGKPEIGGGESEADTPPDVPIRVWRGRGARRHGRGVFGFDRFKSPEGNHDPGGALSGCSVCSCSARRRHWSWIEPAVPWLVRRCACPSFPIPPPAGSCP